MSVRSQSQKQDVIARIQRTIEPFDVAGLSDASRRNWYPAKAGDVLGAAGKVGASPNEIEQLLERAGFYNRV